MPPIVRSVLAAVLGMVVLTALVALGEGVGYRAHPNAEGLDPWTSADWARYAAGLPAWAPAAVAVAWWLGAFAGGWTAATLAPRRPGRHSAFVCEFGQLLALAHLVMIPSPIGMWVAGVAAFPVGGVLATRLATGSWPRAEAESEAKTGPDPTPDSDPPRMPWNAARSPAPGPTAPAGPGAGALE